MSWVVALIIGLLAGFVITSFIWWKITERDYVGDLHVETNEDGGSPLLYLGMKSGAYEKIKKGKYVTFYVQEDPPRKI